MRMVLSLLIVLTVATVATFGQSVNPVTINNFDAARNSTTWMANEGGTSWSIGIDSIDKVEGAASWNVHANLGSIHAWGTYAQFGYSVPDTATPLDWSLSDTVSLWIKVRMAASIPHSFVFRLQIADRPNPSDNKEQWIYENASILSSTSGWVNLKVPLIERWSDGTVNPDSTGFVFTPYTWNLTRNDNKFNRDKIVEWSIALVSTGIGADSVEVSFDNYMRSGARPVPIVLFNGKALQGGVVTNLWAWGNSSATVVEGAGTSSKLNAIQWIQGDQWSNGWTGWGLDISPAFNLAGGWPVDSVKFTMKADTGTGNMRVEFESAVGKRGTVFPPIADNQWHDYSFKLSDMVVQDNAPVFDSSAITKFDLMAEATAKVGKTIYITNLWTGSPVFDLIPPDSATGLSGIGSAYSNIFSWNPVTNKSGITYNVYFADHPWTDQTDSTVEDVLPYNNTTANITHSLRSPNIDQTVSYYYGVVAKDQSGNLSPAAVMSTPVTTLAKGVPTISLTPPASIVVGEGLTEWKNAGIKPFRVSMDSGTAHAKPNANSLAGDADCSALAYVAIDNNYLYVAFDVTDDHVVVDTSASVNDYEQDSPDLFIGLYDWQGKHHSSLNSRDIHFRFSQNRLKIDNGGNILMYTHPTGGTSQNPNYVWVTKALTPGYVVKAKISLADLAAAKSTSQFVPQNGMRIPIDFEINDHDDAAVTTRKGELCYSFFNNDNSYLDMFNWTHTWIGTKTLGVTQTSNAPHRYELLQNYPNPFNPSTQIKYSIEKSGLVSLRVFDLLGREVANLVNTFQQAGSYAVTFSPASRALSSGVYFYRLEAGSFVSVHKMILMK